MVTSKKSHANRSSCPAFPALALLCHNLPTIPCNCVYHAWLWSFMCHPWSFMENKIGDPLEKKGTLLCRCLCCRFAHSDQHVLHAFTKTFLCFMSAHLQFPNIKVRTAKWRENRLFCSFLHKSLQSLPLPTQSLACTLNDT